jgi:hypothetical protein
MALSASRRWKRFVLIDRKKQTERTGTLAQLASQNVTARFGTDTQINRGGRGKGKFKLERARKILRESIGITLLFL